jgi:hypothetical protein
MEDLAPPAGACVQVVSNTWARDSHDLFDFEAQHLYTKAFSIQSSSWCVRNGTEVSFVAEHLGVGPPASSDGLLRLINKGGSFWVDRAASSSVSKKLWLVVRDLAGSGHRLSEGDVIKLGRFKFRARQLIASTAGGTQPELRLDDSGGVCSSAPKTTTALCCRICLLEDAEDDDPFVAPCQCKGSIEYVHLACLRYWIKGRLNLPDASNGSYFYRSLACELCKATYPTYVRIGQDRSPLVEVPRTQPPFIVLENMVRDSQQHSTRGLHVVSLADKMLKLGRGHESDVRIADVSISRCHATIRFTNGSFLLEDNNSKFGTLVALKKPRLLEANAPISIQMGRTVISLTAHPNPGDNHAAGLAFLPQVTDNSNADDERAFRVSLMNARSPNERAGDGEAMHAVATSASNFTGATDADAARLNI